MDPRFGQVAGPTLSDIMSDRVPPGVGAKQMQPLPDPTVSEMLRDQIQQAQAHIKHLEAAYLEARSMGILDKSVRSVRDIVGW